METQYTLRYRDLYQNHWWWRARENTIVAEIKSIFGEQPSGLQILDIGCGDGLFFEQLSRFGWVQGVEPDHHAFSDDGPWRDSIHCQPFDEAFVPPQEFDLILMLDVLEHLPNPIAALNHARRLLSKSGSLLITVPAFNLLWTRHDELNHHFLRYTKSSLGTQASQAKLDVRNMKYFFHWGFPAKLAVRFKEAVVPGPPEPPSVPGQVANATFKAICALEQSCNRFVSLPFGSSLMAILGRDGCGAGVRVET